MSGHWVVLGGGNGTSNLGDESMWLAAAQIVRELDPEARILTEGYGDFDPFVSNVGILPHLHLALRRGRAFPGLLGSAVSKPWALDYAARRASWLVDHPVGSSKLWADAIRSAKGLVLAGSGAICDDYAVHGVFGWSLAVEYARAQGVPILFIGEGIGPLADDRVRQVAARMLCAAERVGVRSCSSATCAEEVGVPAAKLVVTPDWAIPLKPSPEVRLAALNHVNALSGGKPFVGVSFHRRGYGSGRRLKELAVFLDDVSRCADASGATVIFVPNMTGHGYSDDRKTADLLLRRCTPATRKNVQVWRHRGNPQLVRAALGLGMCLFTTRYHPMVFALSEGVPVIGLSYDEYYDAKLEGISSLFGVNDAVFRVDRLPMAETLLKAAATEKVLRMRPSEISSITSPLESFVRAHR
ncbi:polysaccharide pyruvyl transferase family protein [Raineyella sp. LH-20]|uniref:polysaccharide pyruvyl transferase family protein n=1 Tax=Raineyella sp. LH-20 TaxID=3081204 RepID=UPI002954BEF8|nr:polysaccharide pyruvyl transferase family protein [Raineyella sp. LH-20]WOP19684.1 polysaccharide pyruvyl transferase family protein [Raineyella sp. LH-20]